MVIELRVVQFWSEIILVTSNQTRAARSFDFEITRMISNHFALHSVQLLLLLLLFIIIITIIIAITIYYCHNSVLGATELMSHMVGLFVGSPPTCAASCTPWGSRREEWRTGNLCLTGT